MNSIFHSRKTVAALLVLLLFLALLPNFAVHAASQAVSEGEQVSLIVSAGPGTDGVSKFRIANNYTMVLVYDITKFTIDAETAQWLGTEGEMAQHATRTFLMNNVCYDVVFNADPAWGILNNFGDAVAAKTGTRFQTLNTGNVKVDSELLPRDGSAIDIFNIKLTALTDTTFESDEFEVYVANNRATDVTPYVRVVGASGGGDPPPQTQPAGEYTITPSRVDSAEVTEGGAPFGVRVTLTADPTNSPYASVQADLTYAPELVEPDLIGLESEELDISDDGAGTITLTYGPSSGGTVGDGVPLATIPFAPIADGVAVFTVSDNATVSLSGGGPDEGMEAAPGGPLTVTIAAIAPPDPEAVINATYAGAPADCALLTYNAPQTANGYTYASEPMYWSPKLSAYLYIVETGTYDEQNIAAGSSPADAKELTYDGDVNGGGSVRISDAQIVYDLIHAHANYSALAGLDVGMRLAADVNGDGAVDQDDIDAILDTIHGRS
jgi:hypothetical protein